MANSDDSHVTDTSPVSAENTQPNIDRAKTEMLELELAEYKCRLKIMTSMYEDLCCSLSWSATAPIRKTLDTVKKRYFRVRSRIFSGTSPKSEFQREFETSCKNWLDDLYGGRVTTAVEKKQGLQQQEVVREILYVYHSASFGGVERVLLNRAEAFKRHSVPCRISLFFYDDNGALAKIRDYITRNALNDYICIVSKIDASAYDYVVCLDTPKVLTAGVPAEKLVVECHTTYQNGLLYLANLPDSIRHIVVPSPHSMKAIAERFPRLRSKLRVVRNFVPEYVDPPPTDQLMWNKRPLLYLGRFDRHKNYYEVLDIFQHYSTTVADDLFLLLIGQVDEAEDLFAELSSRNIVDKTVILPAVTFDKVWQVYATVRNQKGVFVSASTAESFGLSAAEALSAGLPVILSGIGAHLDLVAGSFAYVYPLGQPMTGAQKLREIFNDYEKAVLDAELFSRQFTEETFLDDWHNFMTCLAGH